MEAFELGAVDYLLKPFGAERVARTLARLEVLLANPILRRDALRKAAHALHVLLARCGESCPRGERPGVVRKLPVEKDGRIALVDYRDIVYARCGGGATRVVTVEGSYLFPGSMCDLTARLAGQETFFRAHKSYLINLQYVREVIPWFKGTYWVVMGDPQKTQIPVSKTQVKTLKSLLGLC